MELTKEAADNFKKYETLKVAERQIKKDIEELKPLIMPFVPEDKELQGDAGVFYIQATTKWKYSAPTQEQEKELKKTQKQEQADGTAEKIETPTLYYRSNVVEETE